MSDDSKSQSVSQVLASLPGLNSAAGLLFLARMHSSLLVHIVPEEVNVAKKASSPTSMLPLVVWLVFLACVPLDSFSQETKPADYSNEPIVYERAAVKVVLQSDGTSTVEGSARVRVQSQAGLQQSGMLNFPYPSANATMEVTSVRVIKPDGRIVQTPAENILDMPAEVTRQAPYYSDLKVEQVAVKGLEIGDRVEYQYRIHVTKPIDPGQFWYFYDFIRDNIALEEILEISVPRDRYVKVQSPKLAPTVSEEGASRKYVWKTSNLERKPAKIGPQISQPEEADPPAVQVTTFRSWDELGQWFRGLVGPRAAVTPEIQAKADELTHGAKSDAEKIQAIYNFVSTKFRYIGISLGIGRYQPHAAADVLTNDYGDCKDKHTLFAALLAAEHIKVYPALIKTSGKIEPDVPSPAPFDHIISVLPQEKGFLFVDTTPEVAPLGFLLATLRDKQALVIPDSGSTQLVQTPADPPFKPFSTFQADGTLDDAGTLVSKMQMTMRGDDELIFRAAMRQAGQPKWIEFMQRVSSNLGFGGTVTDVTASPPDATDVPFHIEYQYTRKEFSDWDNKRIQPPLPPFFLPDPPDDTEKDPKPVKLGSPGEILYTATIKLPAGAKPQLSDQVHVRQSFGEYHAAYSFSEGVLHAELHLVVKEREVPAAEFETYRKFVKAVRDDRSNMIPVFGDSSASAGNEGNRDALAAFEKGRETWTKQDFHAAAEAFQQAVEKDPKYALAWFWLGVAHFNVGNQDQGIGEMKKSLALDPGQIAEYKSVVDSISAKLSDEQALDLWQELEKRDPNDAEATRNIARIYWRQKRYPEAIKEFETSLKATPDSFTQMQLGFVLVQSGEREKGADNLIKATELSSGPMTLNNVAYSLADYNLRLDDALRLAEKAVAETENMTSKISFDKELALKDMRLMQFLGMYWDTLGWVHFRLNHFELAEKYLDAAWNLLQDPDIADHLGQVYEKDGKKHQAAVAYARALSATKPPKETQPRLDALRPNGKFLAGESPNPIALQDLRTVKLGQLAKKHVTAEFFVLFGQPPKPASVKFISGSEELRTAEKVLAAAKFNVSFPDQGPEQIIRRGVLDCEPELPNCLFVLIPPELVQSVQ